MRSSKSRSRNKQNRQRSLGNIINRVFDSSGPEGKVRGTPQQIIDKYLMLARDAQLSNDRVAEQAFLQHAEHYTRLLGEAQRELAREQESRQQQGQYGANGGGNGNGAHGYQGGERSEPRERTQPRPAREPDEQPDFAPLGAVEAEDDGPGLVETPEMYHAPQPAAFDGPAPEFLAAAAAPGPGRPRERGERRDRREGQAEGKPAGGEKGERGPRGPRKPRGERIDAGAPAAAPAPVPENE
jgi:hypothetical protein